MQRPFPICCIFLLTFLGFAPGKANATIIIFPLFEELVLEADFVGVVECVKAGGIVAEYSIIESWKGPKVGTKIHISRAVDYWVTQFPLSLCGERYFVAAYKEQAPIQLLSTTTGSDIPLWWRQIPFDFQCQLGGGFKLLKPGDEKELAKIRKSAQGLLSLAPPEREAALLKAVIDDNLFGQRWLGGETDKAREQELHDRFAKLMTVEALVREMLELAQTDREKWKIRVQIVFEKAGGPITLGQLGKMPANQSIFTRSEIDQLFWNIGMRHQPEKEVASNQPEKEKAPNSLLFTPKTILGKIERKPPTEAKLAEYRKILSAEGESEKFDNAFKKLTLHDPRSIVHYLTGLKNVNEDFEKTQRACFLSSWFGSKCGADRAKHLTRLLEAEDPYIRVAGAVYLCFDDLETGMKELKKLTVLDGDPGAWAALTLARRGQKDAVPRALEVFREPTEKEKIARFGVKDAPHRNLQLRVLELLSNSAYASGVVQPTVSSTRDAQTDALTKWWQKYNGKLMLSDPWLSILEKQQID
jgi:hypothetical protein